MPLPFILCGFLFEKIKNKTDCYSVSHLWIACASAVCIAVFAVRGYLNVRIQRIVNFWNNS